jgi:hypothetical protein
MSRLRNDNRVLFLFVLATAVLAMAVVGCERKITGDVQVDETVSDQCFNCHNGQLDAIQGEWANSIHASGANVDYTSRPGNDCVRCHNQDGFIYAVNNNGALLADPGNAKAIGCFACHNPHENGDLRLRVQTPVTMPAGGTFDVGAANICARCHQARSGNGITAATYQITSSRYGPHHGPQGDLLISSGGYLGFSGFTPGVTLHKDVIKNPFDPTGTEIGGCTGCHMGYANTHEGYDVGGHSWNMKDEAGNSLAADCKSSGCHDAGPLAFTNPTSGEPYDFKLTTGAQDWDLDGVVEGYQSEMEGMLDSLRTLLTIQNIYNPSTGLARTGTYAADLAGAYWNYITVEEDRSLGIHNWQYMASLVQASIEYVSGLPAPTQ